MTFARALLFCAVLGMVQCAWGCQAGGSSPVPPADSRPVAARTLASGAKVSLTAAYQTRLEFSAGGCTFDGSLTMPAYLSNETVPALVIVHGSGPMNQDGEMPGQLGLAFGFEFAAYRELARALQARGVAVLRYPKRFGSATHCPAANGDLSLTSVQWGEDARAALDALAKKPAIDSTRLFYLGHSQGGQMLPWLLSQNTKARGGILLAAPHSPVSALLRMQAKRLTQISVQRGVPPSQAERRAAPLFEAARHIEALTPDQLLGETLGQPDTQWYTWKLMSRGAPWLAARLRLPLLVVAGSEDDNVSADEYQAWQTTLAQSPAAHRFAWVAGMTHALNSAEREGHALRPEPVLAPGLAERIAAFVRDLR